MADFKNDAFLYDGANQADQTLIYDDVKNSFPFEFVYNQVERPAMINAKGKNKVPFNDVPKYIITSNSVIETESESSKRRIAMIFCGGHYNVKNTPIMEFGHNLFNDWKDDQWQCFYKFCLECVQFYLINGLIQFEPETYAKRKTIETYGTDSFSWLKENIISTNGITEQQLETDAMMQSYINYTGDTKISKTSLTKMILSYCRNENIHIAVVSRNGKRFYCIT
jgi:hypothetical protein